ncbi:MAG: glycosyltransferase family 4 protein [Patescibacteria group bacterium]|nr:glycosyltransferase family 4 protein [Patescibacteria group bacterium]
MKIIYIANARIPTEKAHGIQIMKMCEAFSDLKIHGSEFKVELVVPMRFNYIKEDPFSYYGIERKFKIKKLPSLDLIPLDKVLGIFAFLIQSLTFYFFAFFYLLFKRADILYTRDKLFLFFSIFKNNLIYEAHSFPKNYFLYSLFLKRVKGIIVITQKLKNLFVEKEVSQEKILVAPDGVDFEKFDIKVSQEECRKKLNLPLGKKIVLYTGHLYEWKGATTLLKAAWKFETQNPKSETLFVFVGGTKRDIENFKEKAKNLNNVKIVGHRPYTEIPYWLKAADVLVLPNTAKEDISKYWTSPIKLFEYMASKKPIVASDLPSIREILSRNNAILVKPDDPQELIQGIKKALENKNLTEKISNQAFQDVQEYSWEARTKRISGFIENKL